MSVHNPIRPLKWPGLVRNPRTSLPTSAQPITLSWESHPQGTETPALWTWTLLSWAGRSSFYNAGTLRDVCRGKHAEMQSLYISPILTEFPGWQRKLQKLKWDDSRNKFQAFLKSGYSVLALVSPHQNTELPAFHRLSWRNLGLKWWCPVFSCEPW